MAMAGQNRSEIAVGSEVGIIKKQDQKLGNVTEGVVQAILTKSPYHSRGIKVRLASGEIGRVCKIMTDFEV